MIPVTKTFLPPINEFQEILKRAWDINWITNRGELVKELEAKIKVKLGLNHLVLTNNGTIPLQIAIKALGLKGEIITTPFSYVATSSVIVWENCDPVFVDIDPSYFTIDENKIEASITKNTSAILATHVFGNPCNVEVIQEIAQKHRLKVIYDAAHCFGVNYKAKSLFLHGDVSTCSFHATKLFHTAEGGAMFSNSQELHESLFHHHNFGHKGQTDFHGIGINGKMSEVNAAVGLSVLPYLPSILESRKRCVNTYKDLLKDTGLSWIKIRAGTDWNYSYFPVLFENEELLLKAIELLNTNNIFPRRYFYPSLSKLNYVKVQSTPIADSISSRILCLPLYQDLTDKDIAGIVQLIKQTLA